MKAKDWVKRISALQPDTPEYDKAAVECERECREIFQMRAKSIHVGKQSPFQRDQMSDRLVFAYREASVKWDAISHALLTLKREKEGPEALPDWPFVKGLMLLTDIIGMLENTSVKEVTKGELLRYYTMIAEKLGYQDEVVFKAALSMGREQTQTAIMEEIMQLRRELYRLQAALMFGASQEIVGDYNRILEIRARLSFLTT